MSYPAAERILCAIDRSFLGNVKDTFSGGGLEPGFMMALVAWTAAGVCIVLGLGILVNRFVIRRQSAPPAHWIWRRQDLARLFHDVVAKRSKVELCFLHEGRRGACRACSLEDVRDNALELEVASIKEANQTWIGRRVECTFHMDNPKHPGQMTFYSMHNEILGIKKLATGAGVITVDFPDKVVTQQKRLNLRLEPPPQYLLGMAVWPEQLTSAGALERQIKNWGKPRLIYVAGDPDNPFHIENLSAGGIRLDVEAEAVKRSSLAFDIGQTYILLLDLYEPEGQHKLRFWLMGRVQNRYEDFETRRLAFGLQFTSQGQRLTEPKNEMRWKAVQGDGIDLLGNWVVKRHLEMYRKTGLA